MEYQVVTRDTKSIFENAIELLLREGWVLQGSVSHNNGTYMQAMTYTEEEE